MLFQFKVFIFFICIEDVFILVQLLKHVNDAYNDQKKNANSDISSSSEDGNEHIQDVQYSTLTTNNIFSVLDDDLSGYNEYHDDEDDSVDQSPPLYNGRRLSSMKSMKLLMDLLISDINLDKKNI